jgi:N-acetyl-gamma-glutamyl-phosphate reductase
MRPVFIPMRGAFPRGILASCVVQSKAKAETVRAHYRERFEGHPFVHIVDDLPDVKRVVGTNNAVIGMADHDGHVLVVSVIDNLVKGASGQAIQNMNLACGFEETAGLDLVGIGQ